MTRISVNGSFLTCIIASVLTILACLAMSLSPLAVQAQPGTAIQPFTYPDIAGASTTTQLSTVSGCGSVQLLAPAANGNPVRWGDASTSSTRGGVIPPGGGMYLPPSGSNYYPLSSLYVYVVTGDKLQFVCFR